MPILGAMIDKAAWYKNLPPQKEGFVSCQTVMLSLWDSDNNTTASIDLWTKEITIDDMNLHFHQMLHKMADTYLRATNNPDMAKEIHSFADGFGSKLGLN